jgi:hypothetical protein
VNPGIYHLYCLSCPYSEFLSMAFTITHAPKKDDSSQASPPTCDALQPNFTTKIDTSNFRLVTPDQSNKAEQVEHHHQTLRLRKPAVVSSQTIRRADLIYKAKNGQLNLCVRKLELLRPLRQPVSGADIIFKCLQRREYHARARGIHHHGECGCEPPRVVNKLWMQGVS